MKNEYTLENWRIVYYFFSNYVNYVDPKHLIGSQVSGEVYGHPRFTDGNQVITSKIENIITLGTTIIVETQNSFYKLGQIDSEYEYIFPDVWDTLMSQV